MGAEILACAGPWFSKGRYDGCAIVDDFVMWWHSQIIDRDVNQSSPDATTCLCSQVTKPQCRKRY